MTFTAISGQDRVKTILKRAFIKNRIPSAYLFVGHDMDGRFKMAVEFAKLVNCISGKDVCGNCEHCDKINRQIHQDVMTVVPDGSNIKIDQIREIAVFTRNGPVFGKSKVVIIDQADHMTTEAYTAFLKTLEEPALNILFILCASREDAIPDTVASRCQKVIFSDPDDIDKLMNEDSDFCSSFLTDIKNADAPRVFGLWDDFLDTEEIKGRLNKLMVFLWHKLRDGSGSSKKLLDSIKVIANCYRAIENRANLKLALDVMFLDLRGVFNG